MVMAVAVGYWAASAEALGLLRGCLMGRRRGIACPGVGVGVGVVAGARAWT